ncbi:hypothetical protein [Salinarimonas chemoclinalis]|uniref:hypothetical protein n=1 Tax=Salinarimonas chemoclinalis TaxID=3241599 RepID=UPI0035592710
MSDLTLRRALESLFPCEECAAGSSAYFAFPKRNGEAAEPYVTPPAYPPDIFAAAAYLIELSGAYHHIRTRPRARASVREVVFSAEDIQRCRETAEAIRGFTPREHWSADDPTKFAAWSSSTAVGRLYDLWETVFATHGTAAVFTPSPSHGMPPAWWHPTIQLLVIADEAFCDVGYEMPGGEPKSWPDLCFGIQAADATGYDNDGKRLWRKPLKSLSAASPDLVAVLPKARTAAVGCTLRSLSSNLALLPGRGIARGNWTPHVLERTPSADRHMNLLLVPFPFSVAATDFRHGEGFNVDGNRSGYFDLHQSWLRAEREHPEEPTITGLVHELVERAKRDCDEIHGIVLPEMALDHAHQEALASHIREKLPGIEFLVTGLSQARGHDGSLRQGNFVAVNLFCHADGRAQRILTRREKHHRWRLDDQQVRAYGLEGVLSPSYSWWENIDLLSRRVDFAVVRRKTVLSAMICEDLARVDPCQELLRAVGPNIVIALLMDAPQLRTRWPARYATVLAEDPGSSVLTLTSRALMSRQHRLALQPGADDKRIVALWRDDTGVPQEIACPIHAQAIRLSLFSSPATDSTLDGRENRSAVTWRHASHQAIALPPERLANYSDVLGIDDRALRERT